DLVERAVEADDALARGGDQRPVLREGDPGDPQGGRRRFDGQAAITATGQQQQPRNDGPYDSVPHRRPHSTPARQGCIFTTSPGGLASPMIGVPRLTAPPSPTVT